MTRSACSRSIITNLIRTDAKPRAGLSVCTQFDIDILIFFDILPLKQSTYCSFIRIIGLANYNGMSESYGDKEFLEYVIKSIVDHPEKVKVDRRVDEMGTLLTLDIDPEDMGKVIGRMGNTAKAVRTLLRVVGMKNNARVNLKINEPEGGKRSRIEAASADAVDQVIEDLKAE